MNIPTLEKLTLGNKVYTGIGSRETPPNVIRLMRLIGTLMAGKGIYLRSGGADGADSAFETGCEDGPKEIYLPWKDFNGNKSTLYPPSVQAQMLAAEVHPAWHACSPAAKLLHARNAHQVLGKNLKSPAALLICWAKTKNGKIQGGTATAINMATKARITVFNLEDETIFQDWKDFCENQS